MNETTLHSPRRLLVAMLGCVVYAGLSGFAAGLIAAIAF